MFFVCMHEMKKLKVFIQNTSLRVLVLYHSLEFCHVNFKEFVNISFLLVLISLLIFIFWHDLFSLLKTTQQSFG